MPRRFKIVAVGGTFDELHKGHEALILKAFEAGEHVLIGLCSERFVGKMRKAHITAPYVNRLEALKVFLREKGILKRAKIVALDDPYGVALTERRLEALVVSKETEDTGFEINRKRVEAGLRPLKIVVVDMVFAENDLPISTTRVRRGEMDREGHLPRGC